ncbi:aquaporin [Defluviimonas salinarum]|uniref:Aquaporin n=1 Tax=Defluviimonas salinarum TaxID=2992147 RepID=A0ABT3J0D5_9RHOB|nr:aquaporin [Defluviimonas salinarum]MCW3781151.1 aquaporin [Defluviimonas salinarum]
MSKKLVAEVIGTFILVFLGSSAIVFMADAIGLIGISFAFGLGVVAAAYGLGAISGAHLNPAVSIGMVTAGRMSVGDFIGYVIAQVIGAILAIIVLWVIAAGNPEWSIATNGLGQTTVGAYGTTGALVFEAVATFLFVTVILGATHSSAPGAMAGLAIGLTLVLIHLAGIQVSGSSVNPARSLAPALFVGGDALAQLWLYIVAPLAGGAAAGALHAAGFTRADA